MSNKILVLGSTGKTGKRVYKRLQQLNEEVIPASRNSDIPFDWYDQSTWAKALSGINKVYITFQPDLAIPQSLDIITAFVAATKNAGVKKSVLLSGRGELEAKACEDVIIASGLDYTIIRAAFFMQNYSEGYWLDGILSGELIVPKVNAKEPFVDADDIAEMVVKSLLEDEHNGKIYELTGPELLSFTDTAAKISEGIGKPVNVIEVELDEYATMLRSYNVTEDYIWLITYLFGQLLDGRNESVHGSIPMVLGRNATSFDEYVSKTNLTGIWSNNT
ncbi:SDR family oxidoreductase [Parapedobacter tibetensis]|uniref:SDR family oxidoreductase n=1 Tax=Parapedobacter tibetensis TaxID=2972951 RepID=UPI00214D3E2B|nr:NmrA family NAD(P)-binding protein [Parapedobacter tibetensis]